MTPASAARTKHQLRCAIYARVSSDRQDVENSLDRQVRACVEWASRAGHALLETPRFVDEARSGASMLARPAFQQLLGALRSRGTLPFDAVLVDDDSRLDRGGKLAQVVEAFQARGVRLFSVDNGRDLTDESERLLVHVKSGLNEHYLQELARRTRNGQASKVLHGYHAGGRVYGYTLVAEWPPDLAPERRAAENRLGTRAAVNPVEAVIVRRIFESYGDGVGFREIAHRLNAENVLPSRGRGAWDASGVRVILLNRKYVGDWSWNHRRWQKVPDVLLTEAERERAVLTGRHPRRWKMRDPSEVVRHTDEDLRVIDDALWRRVQARFAGRTRPVKGGHAYSRVRNPIAANLRCQCGGPIGTWTGTSRGHTYTRLYCSWSRNRGPTVCGNATTMRLDHVAEPLIAFLRDQLLTPERVARAVERFNSRIRAAARGGPDAGKLAAVEDEVASVQRHVDLLTDTIEKAPASRALLDRLAQREAELDAAKARLEELRRPAAPIPLIRWSARNVEERLAALWGSLQRLDPDRARLALERVLGQVQVGPLSGSWDAGWTLRMHARPWAVLLPKGAVVHEFGCGGGI